MSTPTAASAMQAVADELHGLRSDLHERSRPVPSPPSDRGHVSELARFPALAIAMRFCRDGEDGLARLMRPVPDDHRNGLEVRCLCGATAMATVLLESCPGECGRLFVGDESGVWAVTLPAA
jgi:hypothetical protein